MVCVIDVVLFFIMMLSLVNNMVNDEFVVEEKILEWILKFDFFKLFDELEKFVKW